MNDTNSPERMVIDEDGKDFIAGNDRRDALEQPWLSILFDTRKLRLQS
jgi:hypothetical protein